MANAETEFPGEREKALVGACEAVSSSKDLVAHWTFDQDTAEQVQDSSGNNHAGRSHGAGRAAGKVGLAIECKQDAIVEVPHAAAFDEFAAGLTISAWVKHEPDATWNTIISREVKNGPSEYFGLAVLKNKALFSVDPNGSHYLNIRSDEDIPAGKWVHLAGTYDNKELRLYINGKLAKSAPCTVAFHFADENPIIIGGNTNTQGKQWVDCFHGQIDELRLYRAALREDEILAIYKLNADPL